MKQPFDAEAHADHMATVMELVILPEWRPAVVAQPRCDRRRIAALVTEFPLSAEIEPAPVFEP